MSGDFGAVFSGGDLIGRERAVLADLRRLTSSRGVEEKRVEEARGSSEAAAEREYEKARRALAEKAASTLASDARGDEERRRGIIDAAMAGEKEAKSEFARNSRKIASIFDSVRDLAKNDYAKAKVEAAAAFELGERKAGAQYQEARKPLDRVQNQREGMTGRLDALYADYKKFGLADAPTAPSRENYEKYENPADEVFERLAKQEKPLGLLEGLIIPKAMKGNRSLWLFVVVFLAVVYPFAAALGDPGQGAGAALGVAAVGGFLLRAWLFKVSKEQVSKLYYPIHQAVVDAGGLGAHGVGKVEGALQEKRAKLTERRDESLQKAKQDHSRALSQGEATRDESLRKINEVYAEKMMDIHSRQPLEMREAMEAYEKRRAELKVMRETGERKLEEQYRGLKEKVRARYETAWGTLETDWREGMRGVVGEVEAIQSAVDAIGPGWDDASWGERAFPIEVPAVIRLGELRIGLESLPGGEPSDERLREGVPREVRLPAITGFPDRANLFIEAPAEGRGAAVGLLQAAMFRMLTSLPPGQVRFTIVDPIGIGRSFGAFMHLADFDELLVTNRVWTDPREVGERLDELAAHMEKVTQRYLRNEYATIGEYNAVAGEVAEPYRVLVLNDFPAGLDEKGLARLAGIVAGGPPCGVLTLIAYDTTRALAAGFKGDDFRGDGASFRWENGRLAWVDPEFGQYPLALDAAPTSEFANRTVQRLGAAAKGARRVEVPFEFIAPPNGEYWTRDSRAGIDLPLGKAGAKKRQNLTLGQGTSQHVLIAGRTGSGKSTLLHALITNLALNYSPDEVDLYLIDFKKGVEFKVYATHMLPHASVVAIESEREFGISVLQLLDNEMRSRGDRFRDAGVQDINGYRNAPGTPPLPRCLLIIDEFQEFFVEDDKVGQEAALLLDRLVRQGRAFGVHVHLGSQTLGGAYALARSTLGQMAVRIALQCSEADASLILSEQNPAAQMLTRPGEAVYNDANGQTEGNHFFQVVWLPDRRREEYLNVISELAKEHPPKLKRTPIVFEGDAPADLGRNRLLEAKVEAAEWGAQARSASAWLGDPVAIKEPTAAVFRRQGANHLLIVGQNEEGALGVMASAIISLAAQFGLAGSETVRSGAKFYVLDGTPEDHPNAEVLARVAAGLPQGIEVGGWRDAVRVMGAAAAEVKRRQAPDAPDGPEIFVFVHDLPRFRDLRRKEDDFGFGKKDEDASATDNLATLLTEGPGLGIHVIVWCDNLNNLNRVFTHQGLREFGMRVLFQMSANDSGHLLDSPHASKLGEHRALYVSEEQNRLEKFRPYGVPEEGWLAGVSERIRGKSGAV